MRKKLVFSILTPIVLSRKIWKVYHDHGYIPHHFITSCAKNCLSKKEVFREPFSAYKPGIQGENGPENCEIISRDDSSYDLNNLWVSEKHTRNVWRKYWPFLEISRWIPELGGWNFQNRGFLWPLTIFHYRIRNAARGSIHHKNPMMPFPNCGQTVVLYYVRIEWLKQQNSGKRFM